MAPVVRIDDDVWQWLQGLARPFEDTPNTVLRRVARLGAPERAALFSTRSYARLIRPGLALVIPDTVPGDAVLRRSFQQLERAMDTWCAAAKLAA